jgi:hypothetical protein
MLQEQETKCCSINSELIRDVWSNCLCIWEVLLADESSIPIGALASEEDPI